MVMRLRRNLPVSLPGIPEEHLHSWVTAATREEYLDETHWYKVFLIIQSAFRDGSLPEECTWQTSMLLPNGSGGFRGIVLVDVLWNTVSGIINRQLMSVIFYHDTLHGF